MSPRRGSLFTRAAITLMGSFRRESPRLALPLSCPLPALPPKFAAVNDRKESGPNHTDMLAP